MQGTSEQPAYRSLALYVNGAESWGYRPTAQRETFSTAVQRQGVFLRADLLAWRGPQIAPGSQVEMILVGGNGPSRDPYWDPNAPEWMEWGSASPTDASQTVLATTGLMTVPEDASPPPQPNLAKDARVHHAASTLGKKAIESWRKANPGEARLYDKGDNDPGHYPSQFGKFMASLRAAST